MLCILWFFVAAQHLVPSMAHVGPWVLESSILLYQHGIPSGFVDGWGGNRRMKNLQRVRPTIGGGCKVLDIHPYFGKVISYKLTNIFHMGGHLSCRGSIKNDNSEQEFQYMLDVFWRCQPAATGPFTILLVSWVISTTHFQPPHQLTKTNKKGVV